LPFDLFEKCKNNSKGKWQKWFILEISGWLDAPEAGEFP
jgi:hypothetical protein